MDSKVVKINDLLECPVCIETIISAPIFQCYIDHIVCKDCHPKLETCPICRDANLYDTPMTIRNQKLEEMFKRFQLSNLETAKMTSESIQIDIGILRKSTLIQGEDCQRKFLWCFRLPIWPFYVTNTGHQLFISLV